MTLLAHLSDLHLLERDHTSRRGLARQRLAFLSTGAPLDAERRIRRSVSALQHALRCGADHVLITGDLTEDGEPAQFEVLAEVLGRSGIEPGRVTLVPGNHDAYSRRDAFALALDGPLRAYRATSRPGTCTLLEAAVIAPISTVVEGQWFTRACGQIRHDDVLSLRRLASRPDLRQRAIVVAQHHPPSHRALLPFEWIDGVYNAGAMRELVLERTRVHVLHGHVHRPTTRRFCGRAHSQVFSAASLRDGGDLRLYRAEGGVLQETVMSGAILQPLAAERPRSLAALPLAAFG